MPASFSSDTYSPETLVLGGELLSRKVTIASGAGALVRGTVLGEITASGKYTESLAASEDGSQTPDCILAEDVDATSEDVAVPAYFAGQFDQDALTLGTGHTADSIREGLRVKGIHLIAVQPIY